MARTPVLIRGSCDLALWKLFVTNHVSASRPSPRRLTRAPPGLGGAAHGRQDVPPASSSAVPGPALLGELLSLVQGISGNPALLDDAAGARPSPAAQPGSDQALSAMLQELAASTLGPGMDIQAMEMFAEPHPFQHAQAASSVAGAQGAIVLELDADVHVSRLECRDPE